jgi:hypothetical protein
MKKFYNAHRLLSIVLALALVVAIGVGVFAATYNLNKTFDATVTITAPPVVPVEVTLYTDALCTNPIPSGYLHNFGSVQQGGTPQNPLWFKAAEITPSSINVTDTLAGYNVSFMVGTPINSMAGKPCTLAMWLPNDMAVGVYNFTITATGTGSD